MDLSVIIVSYNVRHFLEQCLKSVIKASEKISCEVFVVDNSSADGSCSMVSTLFPKVKLIMNPVNEGFSAACNKAIKLSSGNYILLLNPDTVVEEDTFSKCIGFMDSNPDAGAMGVKMINGKGRVLPESKRAFPSPSAAFFKLTGLSRLFPDSGFFNRYYLGHIDPDKVSEVEVLSGAFMLLRRKAFEVTGLLDESFFMYGEDIDLSHRITVAGYRNYYNPGIKIIHYKGESAGQKRLVSTLHFYRAMLIFIGKHFDGRKHWTSVLILKSAVYCLATLALLKNIILKCFILTVDASATILIFALSISLWGSYKFGAGYSYPSLFPFTIIPSFTILSLLITWIAGGYKIPSRPVNVLEGFAASSAIILIVYSMLPEEYRFSRAAVLSGSVASTVIVTSIRILLSFAGLKSVVNPFAKAVRTAIVADPEDYRKLCQNASKGSNKQLITGRIGINITDLDENVLGNLSQLKEIIIVNRINRIIFSDKHITSSRLIEAMHEASSCNVEILISPDGENLLIGSRIIRSISEI